MRTKRIIFAKILAILALLVLSQASGQQQNFPGGNASPYDAFLAGALSTTWTGSVWTLPAAITVTRIEIQMKTAPAGCTTNAVVRITDGTTSLTVIVTGLAQSSAPNQNYASGAGLQIGVSVAAAGCTTNPADGNVIVSWKAQ